MCVTSLSPLSHSLSLPPLSLTLRPSPTLIPPSSTSLFGPLWFFLCLSLCVFLSAFLPLYVSVLAQVEQFPSCLLPSVLSTEPVCRWLSMLSAGVCLQVDFCRFLLETLDFDVDGKSKDTPGRRGQSGLEMVRAFDFAVLCFMTI